MQKNFIAGLALMVMAMTSCSQYAADRQSPTDHHKAMPRHTAHHPNPAPSQNQPAHVKAYMNSMHAMHQAMAKGIDAKNADLGFVQGMIPHHQGAIDMANIELQYGKDAQMRALAQAIIDAQTKEIAYMQQWLIANQASQPTATNAAAITQAYQTNNQANHDAMMRGIMAANPDVAFAQGMIPHHQGAIDMANVQLQYGTNPDIRQLASQIKAAQAPEIEQMQNWLKTQGHS